MSCPGGCPGPRRGASVVPTVGRRSRLANSQARFVDDVGHAHRLRTRTGIRGPGRSGRGSAPRAGLDPSGVVGRPLAIAVRPVDGLPLVLE